MSRLDEFTGFLKRNVVDFRTKHQEFKNIEIQVNTETNSRFDGDIVEKVMEAEILLNPYLGPITFNSDNSIARSGIIKTSKRTKEYILSTFSTLQNNHLKIADNFTTSNEDVSDNRILLEIREELCRFRWPEDDPDNERYRGRIRGATGKGTGGKNDDMAIAIMMMIYFNNMARLLRVHSNPDEARKQLLNSIIF